MREDLGSIQQQPVVGLSFMADDNTLLAIKIIFIITADQFSSLDFHHFCSILIIEFSQQNWGITGSCTGSKTTMAIGIYGPGRQDGVISSTPI